MTLRFVSAIATCPRPKLTSSDDDKKICVGDYVFVKCEDDEDDENQPWIAKVEGIYANNQLRVLWTYHPSTIDVPKELEFGPYEILLSDHRDTIAVECLMGFAEVEENCK